MSDNILKYTSRDYDSIKTDLINAIPALTDTWTSREDSDPGIVLIKLMSSLGDMLSYNFDRQALEYYAPTVTQRKNAEKLFNLIGYKMHWYRAPLTTVTLQYEADMPEYVSYLKEAIDAKAKKDRIGIITAYYNYRVNLYEWHINKVYIPPCSGNDRSLTGSISCPSQMVLAYTEKGEVEKPHIVVNLEPDKTYLEQHTVEEIIDIAEHGGDQDEKAACQKFIEDAVNEETGFIKYAVEVFEYWKQSDESGIGLHEYINDPNSTLTLYSNTGELIYSLIPKTVEPGVNSEGSYKATTYLKPYTPLKLKAIQGYLNTVNFKNVQLKNNRFYIPETSVDEEHMYLSYLSVNSNTQKETTVFLKKTDNLLTETDTRSEAGTPLIYFQFGIDDFDYPYIELSSYWRQEIPQDSVTFTLYYFKTLGKYGNITKDYLTGISSPSNSVITISNLDNNQAQYDDLGYLVTRPGYNPENAREAYINSLNYIMTYNTLVTIYDFERYTKRQEGFTNALAVDNQRREDLNDGLRKVIDSYTKMQLLDILGSIANPEATKEELAEILYSLQQVYPIYLDAPATKEDSDALIEEEYASIDTIEKYSLNMHPIFENFATEYIKGSEYYIASWTNSFVIDDNTKAYPYYLYKIYTEDDIDDTKKHNDLENELTKAYKDCHIVNVEPRFTAARVFTWKCCGTVHLTKRVSQEDADKVIENIINHIREVYSPNNMEFGKKITYMQLIETIMEADERIRYFDAGIGDKKLIYFVEPSSVLEIKRNPSSTVHYYNTEAYFNSESLMKYTQTVEENSDPFGEYQNLLIVDPNYIQPQGS